MFLHPHWAILALRFLVMPYFPSTAPQALLQRSCLVIEQLGSSLTSLLPQSQGRAGLLCLLLCLLPWEGRGMTHHQTDACPCTSNQSISKQGEKTRKQEQIQCPGFCPLCSSELAGGARPQEPSPPRPARRQHCRQRVGPLTWEPVTVKDGYCWCMTAFQAGIFSCVLVEKLEYFE